MSHSASFRRGLNALARGEIIVPPLSAYLRTPDFKPFTVQVGAMGERKPDYWFHPSTHPGAPDMVLWLWMVQPDALVVPPREAEFTLAVTIGQIWHDLIGRILLEMGIVTELEVPVSDPERRSRGHMDGVCANGDVWELKTMKAERLRKIDTAEDYLAANPTYHLQANEYLRMSGRRRERVLLMSLSYPYEMREFAIDYDMALGEAVERKYERVLQAVEDMRPPMCDGCWATKGTECPARAVCQHFAQTGEMPS